ncbi:MAG: branched-chain amino acid ABC transporter permease [Candidatus Limnocylindria bacterium]
MDWGTIFDNSISQMIRPLTAVFALAAIGLNVHFGYTGLLNFGQIGFMAVGAYGVAISVLEFGVPLWVGVLIGIGAAVALAALLGIPTLRLRADYLAIVTIAAGEILRLTIMAPTFRDFTGGSDGVTGYNDSYTDLNPFSAGDYGVGFLKFSAASTWHIVTGWTLVLLAVLLVWLLMRSPWGRVLKAIREDEDAVRALGKNVFAYKMQSLILGGVIGAVAGMYWVIQQGAAIPANFTPAQTFYAYVALILGGTARIWGPVVGSMIFWGLIVFTEEVLTELVANDYISSDLMSTNQVAQVRLMLVGLGLVLLMIFRPQGIFGDRNELMLDER